jgi:hypothetical protein
MPANPVETRPRLLAYGGIGFEGRRRTGAWPEVPAGALQDIYGIWNGGLAFGMGILKGEPFLILRQHQNLSNRGGYAYSLLLDPREAVWRRFGWNAAALAAAILANRDLAAYLLDDVENCPIGVLESQLAQLQPPSAVGPAPDAEQAALWVGALTGPSPVVVRARLELHHTVALLNSLPPCFRAGNGWLAGGGRTHGLAFGSRLVWDDRAKAPTPDLPEIAARGRTTLCAWHYLQKRADTATRLARLSEEPFWRWGPGSWSLLLDLASGHHAFSEALRNLSAALSAGLPVLQAR